MIKRDIQKKLIQLANKYPVVTLIGPRQSGKTTLVKESFPNKIYVNLESIEQRDFALSDPKAFLNKFPEGAIFDEIQRVPDLLSYIQLIVDAKEQMGLFILTGSHQFELRQGITQSLAGRTALLDLLPLSIRELNNEGIDSDVDSFLLKGFFPRIYRYDLDPFDAYRNYFRTYVERDVRQLINIKNILLFEKFIRLCAGRIGQVFISSNIANEVGVSNHTIDHWLSILEASFIIFRLPPFYENFGKRLIKSPKLYFTDVGLASYLLGIENKTQLERDPLRGNLFENLVILELLKSRLNQGKEPRLYFYRDRSQYEIDIVFISGNQIVPIEIKSSQTFNADFLKNMKYFKGLASDRCEKGFVIYAGDIEQNIGDFLIINYKNTSTVLTSPL